MRPSPPTLTPPPHSHSNCYSIEKLTTINEFHLRFYTLLYRILNVCTISTFCKPFPNFCLCHFKSHTHCLPPTPSLYCSVCGGHVLVCSCYSNGPTIQVTHPFSCATVFMLMYVLFCTYPDSSSIHLFCFILLFHLKTMLSFCLYLLCQCILVVQVLYIYIYIYIVYCIFMFICLFVVVFS